MRILVWLLRIAAAVVLVVLSTSMVLTQYEAVQAEKVRMAGQLDPASAWEERLLAVRDALPPNGLVGYISEENIPGLDYSPIDSDEEFAMTQYFLAPRILVRGTILEYTVGNLVMPKDHKTDLKAVLSVQKIISYGMGIYLIQRAQP